jgi:hypothetical protein
MIEQGTDEQGTRNIEVAFTSAFLVPCFLFDIQFLVRCSTVYYYL